MSILMAMVVYIAIAVAFVLYVRRRTSKKLHLWLAIAFVILLPSWDVLLGFIVYYPACLFVPKTAIYETAETDGIYYEGDARKFLLVLSDGRQFIISADSDYRHGFKYTESLIRETGDDLERHRVSPVVYRCETIPLRPDEFYKTPINCKPASSVQSDYLVKTDIIVLGRAGIGLVKVYNRRANKLMAEYRVVEKASSTSLLGLPFFNWLKITDGSPEIISCPKENRFDYFHYDVLKPKK
jgi:amino acid transporter